MSRALAFVPIPRHQEEIMRNFVLTLAASVLALSSFSARVKAQSQAEPQPSATSLPASQSAKAEVGSTATEQKDESAATTTSFQSKSATGKITAVSGDTFAIEVGGDSKETMQFVTDSNTAKSGDLKVGADANVQYHSGSDGKNTATKVDIQG
jgi:hypothetical protein